MIREQGQLENCQTPRHQTPGTLAGPPKKCLQSQPSGVVQQFQCIPAHSHILPEQIQIADLGKKTRKQRSQWALLAQPVENDEVLTTFV